ncbi:uncharacterized protein LOC6528289 [Drosophila yakuba]|uniref:uncharacterized protein LOC6528289 n=1 Tax=Drosophila yakuba TaxID=7245 RepID=UPI00193077E9|nr:uncharacterized protein LOC6528289 [Drosophila yakuba]
MKLVLLVLLCSGFIGKLVSFEKVCRILITIFFRKTKTQLVYKLKKIECLVNRTRVSNVSCHVKPVNWNLAVVNMDCFMIVPLLNPIIRIQVFTKDYSNQYKPFLVDVKIRICEVIERRNFIPYGVIIWKLFKRYTNVNHSCPFSVLWLTCVIFIGLSLTIL